jgi:DNA-binding NarL/FixJ family response regulator
MPRDEQLNELERGQILAYRNTGKDYKFIAKQLGRSASTIRNVKKLGTIMGKRSVLDVLLNFQAATDAAFFPVIPILYEKIKEE